MGKDFLTDAQLKAIMPLCPAAKRKVFAPWLNLSMAFYEINNQPRVAMYLAQLAHESTDLTVWTEDLNYTAHRLTEVWPRRFPTIAAATPYAHNPKALANKTYGGRLGNRPGTDDGWTFRGRAPIQCTGRDLYEQASGAVGEEFGVDFLADPDLLLLPKYGFLVSAWIFAVEKDCLPLADAGNIRESTHKINGGYNGLADRVQNYRAALRVIPDDFSLKSYGAFSKEVDALATDDAPPVTKPDTDVTNQDSYPAREDDDPAPPPETKPPPSTTAGPDTVITKDRPSTFTRWMTGIKVVLGAGMAGISAYCGGTNVQEKIANKAVDTLSVEEVGMIILYSVIGVGMGVFLIWIASVFYDRSANRANKLNSEKLAFAANEKMFTVEFKGE